MARFTQSPLTPNLSGKIGGMSISSSQSGKIMKVSGRQFGNSSQQSNNAKNSIVFLLNKWRNLTQAQRDQWQQYSIFRPVEQRNNPGRFINGQQYYVRYNSAYYNQFSTTVDNVTFATDTPFTDTLSLRVQAGNLRLESINNIDETNDFVLFKMSNSMPPSRKNPTGGVKLMQVIFANSNSTSIQALCLDLFGANPATGDTVFIEYTFFKTLFIQWSAPTAVKVIIT